jgi:hypothetical protein
MSYIANNWAYAEGIALGELLYLVRIRLIVIILLLLIGEIVYD